MVVLGGCGGRVVLDHDTAGGGSGESCTPATWTAYDGTPAAQLTPGLADPVVWAARVGPFEHAAAIESLTLDVKGHPARFAVGLEVDASPAPPEAPLERLTFDGGQSENAGRVFVLPSPEHAAAGAYAFVLLGAGAGADVAFTSTARPSEGRAWRWTGGAWEELGGELVAGLAGCEDR